MVYSFSGAITIGMKMKSGRSGTGIQRKTCLQATVTALLIIFLSGGITVPASGQEASGMSPQLSCSIDIPEIRADNRNLRYNPMPFPVTVTIRNVGSETTDSLTATIIVQPDLSLAGVDSPDNNTKLLSPPILQPDSETTVLWMVKHPATLQNHEYSIKVWVKSSNAAVDSTMCEVVVKIPLLDSPILSPRCFVPDALYFDKALDSYVPNPFTVRLTTTNKGNVAAHDVTATFVLPEGLEFDPPGQPQTRTFNPSILRRWNIGDPVPEVSWSVRWADRLRERHVMKFRFTVTSETPSGIGLDSAEVQCEVPVPGLRPWFNCSHEWPDSLSINAAGTSVEPNPFRVKLTLINVSHINGGFSRAYINFPPDGLSLNPASPDPRDQMLDLDVAPGDSASFEYLIDVENRFTRRNIRLSIMAFDDEGNPMDHAKWIRIANLQTSILDCLTVSDPILQFIVDTQTYDPASFVVTAKLTNTGATKLHNLSAKLDWTDPGGRELVELDSDRPNNSNPKRYSILFPEQSVSFEWEFRIKNKNESSFPKVVDFSLTLDSDEAPIASSSIARVEIRPAFTTGIEQSEPPMLFSLEQNHPNPFDVSTTITYELEKSATVRLVVHDMLGRQVAILTEGEMQAGLHRAAFDGSSFPDGVYIYTLQAEGKMYSKQMVLMR